MKSTLEPPSTSTGKSPRVNEFSGNSIDTSRIVSLDVFTREYACPATHSICQGIVRKDASRTANSASVSSAFADRSAAAAERSDASRASFLARLASTPCQTETPAAITEIPIGTTFTQSMTQLYPPKAA
ncbi:hypothetical protein [Actinotignum sp. GS-2025d]|uniref:hypothetical protein n=1 Tax=Actinotignum sp. GS-2025d TaxID=3427277 RepID=UPI003F44C00F